MEGHGDPISRVVTPLTHRIHTYIHIYIYIFFFTQHTRPFIVVIYNPTYKDRLVAHRDVNVGCCRSWMNGWGWKIYRDTDPPPKINDMEPKDLWFVDVSPFPFRVIFRLQQPLVFRRVILCMLIWDLETEAVWSVWQCWWFRNPTKEKKAKQLIWWISPMLMPSLKLTASSHLKVDAWNTILSFWDPAGC